MTANETGTNEPLLTFAIITDTHIRPPGGDDSSPFPVNELANDRARYAVAAIARQKPEFTIHLGDMVHPLPHLPTYGEAADEALRILEPLSDGLHFVPGNHDVGDKPMVGSPAGPVDEESIEIYRKYFGPGHYSFDSSGLHIIVMNSSLVNTGNDLEAKQRVWLEDDLERHASDRTILFTHYPPFITDPDEPAHYDNYDRPGRAWLLDLVRKYEIEAVFSGHVHQFFYNRTGNTKLYCLPPTSFTRQDYSELYNIGPAAEYGRNDTGKFSYALVDVYEDGHRIRVIPTDGRCLGQGETLTKPDPISTHPSPVPLVVHLRHAWARATDMPYNGPMEEYARKRARDDNVLLRLWQMGISCVRTPLADLLDSEYGPRVKDFHAAGIRFTFFCPGAPEPQLWDACVANKDLIETLEIVTSTADLSDIAGQISKFDGTGGPPVHIGKFHSSAHEPKRGSTFAHSVSFGFKWEDREALLPALRQAGPKANISGVVFQVNLEDELASRFAQLDKWGSDAGLKTVAVIKLADANPAIANFGDEAIAKHIGHALEASEGLENLTLQLDTYTDIDRGYHPRHGLVDGRSNLRQAGRLLANR